MSQDLLALLKSLETFYGQNVGAISLALWNQQEQLNLTNQDVVEIITALATVKERVNNEIDNIMLKVTGSIVPPEV